MTDYEVRFMNVNGYLDPWYKQKISFGSLLSRLETQYDSAVDEPVIFIFMAYPRFYHVPDDGHRRKHSKKCAELKRWLEYVRALEDWVAGGGENPEEIAELDDGIEYDGTYSMGAGKFLKRLSVDVLEMDVMQFAYIDYDRIAVLLRSPFVNKMPDGWFEDQMALSDFLNDLEATTDDELLAEFEKAKNDSQNSF